MKKFLGVLLMISMLCGAVFAGGQGDKSSAAPAKKSSSDKLKVYLVSVMSGGAAWGQCEKGFMQACKEMGWEGHYLAPSSANVDTEMVNLLETAITNGADILFPVVTNEDMFADVLMRARERKIPMICIAGGSEKYCDAIIGTDPQSLGSDEARALIRAANGQKIYVAPMSTNLTNSVQNIQVEAFLDTLKKEAPDAVVVDRMECNSDATIAASKIAALKLGHPELNSITSFDSYAGLGGAQFVSENNLKGKFFVVGIDDSPEILRAVKDGTMSCTVAQMWYQFGVDGVKLAKVIYDNYGDKTKYKYDNKIPTSQIFPQDVDAWVQKYGIDMSANF